MDNFTGIDRQIAEAYDQRPYTSNPFSYTAPAHLRAAAFLYGIQTVPLQNARVLELGCAAGGNLIPFAILYPQAQIVGVDLSSVQINQGQDLLKHMGIENVQLHAISISDITPEFGQFDYIIVHGVFSWVPPEVRQDILRVCRENLSPEGLAYISYNTYPGWKAGEIVRDAMLLHSHFVGDEQKVESARAMLTLLSDGLAVGNSLRPSLLNAVQQLRSHTDYYIAHEYLETFNSPCYFVEFADIVSQAGLTHVGDAEPRVECSQVFGLNVQLNHSLIAFGQNRLMRQQYLDFAVGRNFRKSMVVHAAREGEIFSAPDLSRLSGLRFSGYFESSKRNDDVPAHVRAFKTNRGELLHVEGIELQSALDVLHQSWPQSISGQELLDRLTQLPEVGTANQAQAALESLFHFGRYLIELDDEACEPWTSAGLLAGFAPLAAWRRQKHKGIGQYNRWHNVANITLTPAEYLVLEKIHQGQFADSALSRVLCDAWVKGLVPGNDGVSLKGQRNLDAKAVKVVTNLKQMLVRQGLVKAG
ncbi:methyltransferase regulatory domain-containing protein [Alcaligenes sp.]|uniref:methyltransferase regulatory domain-containing protein n=1 Tax=Alcaligenes sp. TaxID=512 RepID=UPI003CFBDF38